MNSRGGCDHFSSGYVPVVCIETDWWKVLAILDMGCGVVASMGKYAERHVFMRAKHGDSRHFIRLHRVRIQKTNLYLSDTVCSTIYLWMKFLTPDNRFPAPLKPRFACFMATHNPCRHHKSSSKKLPRALRQQPYIAASISGRDVWRIPWSKRRHPSPPHS